MKENQMKSKERILNAALDIFAEIGYDAARVDEIALKAKVKKPLIYYYFKSKQEILEELIDLYIQSIVEEKENYISNMENISEEILINRFDQRSIIIKENEKYLKIIALEILKNSPVAESILTKLKPLMTKALPKFESMGLRIENPTELAVAHFFFGMTPTLMLELFGEKFCEIYGIELTQLEILFNDLFKNFYIKSVANLLERSDQS